MIPKLLYYSSQVETNIAKSTELKSVENRKKNSLAFQNERVIWFKRRSDMQNNKEKLPKSHLPLS